MDQHLVWLSSNIKPLSGRINTQAEFVTRLSFPLQLQGDWEIGLAQITFCKSWFNITQPQLIGLETRSHPFPDFRGVLLPGCYEEPSMLANEINKIILTTYPTLIYPKLPKIVLNNATRECEITPGKNVFGQKVYPVFGDQLSEMLGFHSRNFDHIKIDMTKDESGARPNLIPTAYKQLNYIRNSEMSSDQPDDTKEFLIADVPQRLSTLKRRKNDMTIELEVLNDLGENVQLARRREISQLLISISSIISSLEPLENDANKYNDMWRSIVSKQHSRAMRYLSIEDERIFSMMMQPHQQQNDVKQSETEFSTSSQPPTGVETREDKKEEKTFTTQDETIAPSAATVLNSNNESLEADDFESEALTKPADTSIEESEVLKQTTDFSSDSRKPTDLLEVPRVSQTFVVPPRVTRYSKKSEVTNEILPQPAYQHPDNDEISPRPSKKVKTDVKTKKPMTKKEHVKEKPDRCFDLNGGIHSLFVYCDAIKSSFVGDTSSPLLRAVDIPSNKKFGNTCSIQFTEIFFVPCNFRELYQIEISIKDDTNQPIGFKFGKTLLLLIIRRKL